MSTRKTPKARTLKAPGKIATLTNRLAGMELREAALKQEVTNLISNLEGEVKRLARDQSAMRELKDLCFEIKGAIFIMFEAVCNLDDLVRPRADEPLRQKRIQLFNKN